MSRVIVACAGNATAGDDAVGALVLNHLRDLDSRLELLDLSTGPMSLLDHLDDCQALALVDAAVGEGLAPGQIIECDWLDPRRPPIASDHSPSTHGLTLATALQLAYSLAQLPARTRLFAIAITPPTLGTAPTTPTTRAATHLATRIVQWAHGIT